MGAAITGAVARDAIESKAARITADTFEILVIPRASL